MTVITLATVGFGEIHPLGNRGRLFTISLILMGVVSIGYIVNRFTEALIQGYFQEGIRLRQQRRLMESLSGHYILCGFGRTGRQIALEFQAEGVLFVAVDLDIESVQAAQQLGYIALQADATLDESLLKAKIERAICLVPKISIRCCRQRHLIPKFGPSLVPAPKKPCKSCNGLGRMPLFPLTSLAASVWQLLPSDPKYWTLWMVFSRVQIENCTWKNSDSIQLFVRT